VSEIRVLIGATDFERAVAFYSSLLGFAIQEQWKDDDGRGILFRCSSGGVIEVFEDSPHHPAETPRGVKVALEVDDVDALYARIREAGTAEIVDPIGDRPWKHRNFEIRDPDGLPLVFFMALETS
jgi:predicted enzyme related to lactoylglutathione lyase